MLLIVVRARARVLFTDGGVYRFSSRGGEIAREAIFFARLSGRGKIVRKMINERAIATRDTQNLSSSENCECWNVYVRKRKNCVEEEFFILRSVGTRFFFYANFVRLIVEIIFQRWLKRIEKRRNCGVNTKFVQVCKLFNCWNWPKKRGYRNGKGRNYVEEEFYFLFQNR